MNYSIKNQINLFWKYSTSDELEKFDFDNFFGVFKLKIYKKLACHGQLKIEDYIKCQKKYYNLNKLKYLTYKSFHTGFEESYEDILRNIFFYRFLHFKKKFRYNSRYINLKKIYKLLNKQNLTKTEKVLLVDKCIHVQHNSGNIININIEKMRKEYERKDE